MILDFSVRFDKVTCLKDCGNILYKCYDLKENTIQKKNKTKTKNNKFKFLITINAYIW